MACGTPVVATRNGAVPEVIEDGKSGIIVDDFGELAAAVERAAVLSPKACRDSAVEWFSPARMVTDYLAAYEHLLQLSV
jgi:glycosyltransferase involved in cell wall biosynthesis